MSLLSAPTQRTHHAALRGEHPRGTTVKTDHRRRGAISFYRNLPTARKLLVLTGICLTPSIVLGVVAVTQLQTIDDQTQAATQLERASAKLYHLDNRNSELKSDAYRALVEQDLAQVSADGAEDVASVEEVMDTLDGLELPAGMEQALVELAPAIERNNGFITDFVALAEQDRAAAMEQQPEVAAENQRLDAHLDELRAAADEAVSDAQAKTDRLLSQLRWLVLIVLGVGLVLAVALALGIGRMIAAPLRRTVAVLEAVAAGRLDERLDVDTRDEVGQMASALNTAVANLGATMSSLGDNAQALASSSEELSSVSSQMSGSAQESASQADLVSAAAEQVSLNVQTVATGTEEMSASIREIAQNATAAAGVAAQAVVVAESANVTVAKLGDSSAEVGNVIKVINSIAEQTNLLALNATIEAARAGEAGKGFAVVANEVKELAQGTSKATEDIGRRIEAIQSDTQAAVAAISQISEIIAQINDTQSTIASAVEEQTATTNEMGRNVSEAATGSTDIATNITGVARSASDTTAAATSTNQAADELARMASQMQQLVGQFRY
ncbi:MAG TPA: methyl-accepting chemotaxis protein [Nocardioidaceae bacterium]|nr:methyl-accepting chemotaxis protein [Nocardioidaceae bacterium]